MAKNLVITVENVEGITEVTSYGKMWKAVKELFAKHGNTAHILVTEDGAPFKDLTIKTTKAGKNWMVNSITETNRSARKKAKAAEAAEPESEQEVHEIETEDDPIADTAE